MKTVQKILVLSVIAVLTACSVPHMAVDNQLQSASAPMAVKGRNGWLINQKLAFGEYRTGKVNRSWTKAYDIPFIIRFSGAKERLSYTITDGSGNEAETFAMAKLSQKDLPLFNKLFEVNLDWKDVFSGTVALEQGRKHYDFVVANLNQNNWFREAAGFIRYQDGEIDIQPVKNLDNGQRMLAQQAPGFQFVYRGETIGAVETLNEGRIWIKDGLPADLRLALASVSAALLLRSELQDKVEG